MDAFTGQSANAAVAFTNAAGAAAAVDGVPTWASSDDTVVAVAPAADGMSAVVSTVAPGTARVTVHADADLGAGVTDITGVTEDIVVTVNPNQQASVVNLTLQPFTNNP